MSDALDELAGALAKFQAECPVIPKKQVVQVKTDRGAYSYTYADLASIAPVVMPLLAKHGLAFTTLPQGPMGDQGPVLRGMLVHTSGQSLVGELPIAGRTPQEIGSSLTYGRRYLLGCLTGVVTDDDDDGGLAERNAQARKRAEAPPPVAPPQAIRRRTPPGPPTGEVDPAGEPPRVNPPDPGAQSTGPDAPMTTPQRGRLFAAMAEVMGDAHDTEEEARAERLALVSAVLGRRIATSKELTQGDATRVLAFLDDAQTGLVAWVYDPAQGVAHIQRLDEPE